MRLVVYFTAILAQIAIRWPFARARRHERQVDRRVSPREQASLALLSLGMLLLPSVYAATDWLAFADYAPPPAAAGLGGLLLAASLLVFWRAHADIGVNWSPSLEIRAHHELVTRGIYRHVRHPMYASLLLWSLAQPLLLHNYIAGLVGPVAFAAFYALRVGPEERMMLDTFGDRYRDYMRRTGGVIPRASRR